MLFVRLKEIETASKSSYQQSVQNIDVGDEIRQHHEALQQQVNSKSEALRLLHVEYDSAQRELQLLLEAIDKRHELLDSLDSQLDSTIIARRHDIEVHWDKICKIIYKYVLVITIVVIVIIVF